MRQEHPESRIELQHNRPTLSILGIESGNVDTGTRSAIPGSASARIEMRLVNGLSAAHSSIGSKPTCVSRAFTSPVRSRMRRCGGSTH